MGERISAMLFVGLVKEMRAAQGAYWQATAYTPDKKTLLARAKELEKEVDECIAAIDGFIAARKQPGLWTPGGD